MDPVWVGDTVYFISDRDGVVERLVVRHAATKQLAQVTSFTDFDVKTLDAGGGVVVFEQAGFIHRSTRRPGSRAVVHHPRDRRLPVDDAALGGRDRRA